ncbi:hypothetical protein [Citrobacter phage Ci1]|nr:hypothetical protein [Citrobacter phage Ci1]
MTTIFVLLIAFQIKHFLADYPLQGKYMLGKFRDHNWEVPLAAHAGLHATFTFVIAMFFGFEIALGVALLDFGIHFIVDRLKVVFSRGVTTQEPKFWWLLGLDQLAHHLTHYTIIAILVFL